MFGFLLQHQSNNIKQIWCSMDKIFIYILLPTNDHIAGTWWCIVLIALLHRDDLFSFLLLLGLILIMEIKYIGLWDEFPTTFLHVVHYKILSHFQICMYWLLFIAIIVILAIHKITLTVDYTTTVCVPVCGMVDRPPSKVNSFLHRKVVSVAAV